MRSQQPVLQAAHPQMLHLLLLLLLPAALLLPLLTLKLSWRR
jgi:hypothetical protein